MKIRTARCVHSASIAILAIAGLAGCDKLKGGGGGVDGKLSGTCNVSDRGGIDVQVGYPCELETTGGKTRLQVSSVMQTGTKVVLFECTGSLSEEKVGNATCTILGGFATEKACLGKPSVKTWGVRKDANGATALELDIRGERVPERCNPMDEKLLGYDIRSSFPATKPSK